MNIIFIAEFDIFKWGLNKRLGNKICSTANKYGYGVNGLITLNTNIYIHTFILTLLTIIWLVVDMNNVSKCAPCPFSLRFMM